MRKLIIPVFALLFLVGCEKKFDNPIDVPIPQYRVISVSSDSTFVYSPDSSSLTLFIKINPPSEVKEVTAHVFDSDNNELENSPIQLLDDGKTAVSGDKKVNDSVFTNKFKMSSSYPIGKYAVKYFIMGTDGQNKLAAVQYFNYDNGQTNQPPVISNIVAPDTLVVTSTTKLEMTVDVSDPNGLNDIKDVYFITYKPDGTTNGSHFSMYDDGDTNAHGDIKAGDGTYSIIIQITPSNAKGTYRFDFQAVDRSNATSNIISHNIVVK